MLTAGVILFLAALNVSQYLYRPEAPAPREPTRQEVIDEFQRVWAANPRGLFFNRWFGISTLQNPNDVWITQEILWQVKPDFVVETGTYHGGSAVLWATLLEHINPDARVITIDIEDQREPDAKTIPIVQRRVDFLLGSSTDPRIVAEVTRRVEGKKVVVILDSLHTMEHVLAELRAYAPLVQPGGYIIVQDTVVGHPIPGDPGPGAWEAVQAFMQGNDEFRVDARRERLLLSNNPGGFLSRAE